MSKTAEKTLIVKHGLSRAIFTKFIGQTEHKPSRIKAYDTEGFSATVSKSEYNTEAEASEAAVRALCAKMEWTGELVSGGTKQGNVWVFVGGAK